MLFLFITHLQGQLDCSLWLLWRYWSYTSMARYDPCVLKVPLNTNQPTVWLLWQVI